MRDEMLQRGTDTEPIPSSEEEDDASLSTPASSDIEAPAAAKVPRRRRAASTPKAAAAGRSKPADKTPQRRLSADESCANGYHSDERSYQQPAAEIVVAAAAQVMDAARIGPPLLEWGFQSEKGQQMEGDIGGISAIGAESMLAELEASGTSPPDDGLPAAVMREQGSASSTSSGENGEAEARELWRLLQAFAGDETATAADCYDNSVEHVEVAVGALAPPVADEKLANGGPRLADLETARDRLILRMQELSLELTISMDGDETGSESLFELASDGDDEGEREKKIAGLQAEIDRTARALARLEIRITRIRQPTA